ncbi:MAG: hypothetical protein J6P73_07495 [Bacteroidales bacterium]|nr:hypothetical protein [Bacteroidales bacterium]
MKKILLASTIILGISFYSYAQNGGLFGYGQIDKEEESYDIAWYSFYQNQDEVDNSLFGFLKGSSLLPNLPNHDQNDNQNAPLGDGIVLLISLGTAYVLKKRKK